MKPATLRFLTLILLASPLLHPALAGATETSSAQTVCLQCHGAQDGTLGEPVRQWTKSIHAANGISCHDCHGGDPQDAAMAMSPERGFLGAPEHGEIPDFCGRCHIGVREDYLTSAHGAALNSGGPQCVTCHGAHAVSQASIELINPTDCSRCHGYERAETLRSAIHSTEQLISGIETDLASLYRLGLRTKDKQERLFASRNDFRRLFHSVDAERVKLETEGITKRLDVIADEIADTQAQLQQRKLWGGITVLVLVLAGIVALLIRRTYHEEETPPS